MRPFTLVCSGCGRPHDPGTKAQRCVACKEPLAVRSEAPNVPWPPPPGDLRRTLLRFTPFEEVPEGVTLGEGATPLIRANAVAEGLGLAEVWLKCEGLNPTGSFKDRGTVTGLLRARQLGLSHVGTVSTGNMGMSVAAYAARAGVRCLVLVSAEAPPGKAALIAAYGATVVRYRGDYGDLYFEALRAVADLPLYLVTSDDPFRVEGQKLVMYEIVAQLGGAPDVVVVPVSSGGNISAVATAIEELEALGAIPRRPRLVGVQAEGCNPVAAAFREGRTQITRGGRPRTIATALTNPLPPSGNRVLRALRRLEGLVVDVSDEEIRAAQAALAFQEGLWVQPDSATTLAALRRLVAAGQVAREDRVVCVLTGHGMKDTSVLPTSRSGASVVDAGPADLAGILHRFCAL